MLTRWNPVNEMLAMQNAMDRVLDDAWRPFYDHNIALDIDESDTGYVIHATVPGIKPNDIDVRVQDNVMTITGETEAVQNEENKRVLMRERRYGKFSRSVRFADRIDAENIVAEYENGILRLEVPKAEDAQPRRIAVNAR